MAYLQSASGAWNIALPRFPLAGAAFSLPAASASASASAAERAVLLAELKQWQDIGTGLWHNNKALEAREKYLVATLANRTKYAVTMTKIVFVAIFFLSGTEKKVKRMVDQKGEMRDEVKRLVEEKEEMGDEAALLRAYVRTVEEKCEEKIEDLQGVNGLFRERVGEMAGANVNLTAANEKLAAKNSELAAVNAQLVAANVQLAETNAELHRQAENWQLQLLGLEELVEGKEKQLKKSEKENKEKDEVIQGKNKVIETRDEQIEHLEAWNADLMVDREEMEEQD